MASDPEDGAAPGPLQRLAQPVIAVFVAVILLPFGVSTLWTPIHEWDLLGYLGCVEEFAGASEEELHTAVFERVADELPAEDVAALRGEGPVVEGAADPRGARVYRQRLADDPAAFSAQLPFYRGRLTFLAPLYMARAVGLSPLRTTYWLSMLAGVAFGILFVTWISRFLPNKLAVLGTLAAFPVTGAAEAMGLATPDMLAGALLFGGAFCLFETHRRRTALVLLVLAVATRADHVLLAAPLLLADWWSAERDSRPSAASIVTGLALLAVTAWLCTAGRGTYGWWTVFHHTFVEYKALPADETPARDLGMALERSFSSLPMFKAWRPLTVTLFGLGALFFGFLQGGLRNRWFALACAALAASLVHFLLFPALWPRLMLPYWAVILVAGCGAGEPEPQSRSAQASP